jgi:hypothetical protein
MNSPFISWQDWESHVLDFFRFVLPELVNEPNLPHLEADKMKDNLNRRLAIICRKKVAIWEMQDNNRPSIAPDFGGRNQPRVEDALPHESENKEPDGRIHKFINKETLVSHSYTVECKRLDLSKDGSPHGKSEYYVNDGILRFMKREYSYGIDVESGLMIGYLQSSDFDKFLLCVNHYCKKASVPNLTLSGTWKSKGVSELDQILHRTEMKPNNFQLRHFWVDLR